MALRPKPNVIASRVKLMNKSEYARHRGVSPTTVASWVKNGLIELRAGSTLDVEECDRRLAESLAPPGRRPKNQIEPVKHYKENEDGTPVETVEPESPEWLENGDFYSYDGSRAKKEHFNARRAEVEYEKAAGTLLDKELWEARIFTNIRMVRDRVLAVADRAAPNMAGLSDARECREALYEMLMQALDAAADELDELVVEQAEDWD